MSTTEQAPADAEEYQFTPKLPPHWALNLEQVVAVAAFGVLFVLLNFIPLRATDIWGHVLYGQWIIEHRAMPSEDPWMPLAQGMEVVDTAWLSQVIFAAVEATFGPEALSHLFALASVLAYVIWARLFFLQTRRVWLSLLCVGLVIVVGWSRIATVRPENFAALCFAGMFLLAVRLQLRNEADEEATAGGKRSEFYTWLGIPVLFALWANLHGSYMVGWAVLGCYLLGRVLQVAWQTRDLSAVLTDAATRRWVYVLELAIAATLLNPYGIDLWIHTVQFSANPNLASILEWQPLVVFGVGGRPFAFSIVLLLFIWRQSRRPIRPAEVLMLAVFGIAALTGIRMLGWYAPVFAVAVAPHIADIARRWLPENLAGEQAPSWSVPQVAIAGEAESTAPSHEEYELPPGRSFRYSLVALLLIWIAFALSPSSQIIFDKSRPPEQLYAAGTPIQLTDYLHRAHSEDAPPEAALPAGQAFNPQWWGDWIQWQGPEEFQAFVTSNIHLVPPQVWRDYQRVIGMQSGWQATLERYDVETVVVDKTEQESMYRALNRDEDWRLRYEDDKAAVFIRQARTPAPSRTSNRNNTAVGTDT